MKYILIIICLSNFLLSNTIELSPYLSSKDYSPDISQKDLILQTGIKMKYQNENQNYIFDFSKQYIKYRSSKKDIESNFIFIYNYNDNTHIDLQAGVNIKKSTKNDATLTDIIGEGKTLILGAKQHFYNTSNHKISVGSNFFATYYKQGIDDLGKIDKIFIYQISPTIKYSIDKTYIEILVDYIKTPMYSRKDNGLVHMALGFSLGSFDIEFSGFYGKAKSVVLDHGYNVINNKNEYQQQTKLSMGYNISKNLKATFHVSQTDIQETVILAQEYNVGARFSYIFSIPEVQFGF